MLIGLFLLIAREMLVFNKEVLKLIESFDGMYPSLSNTAETSYSLMFKGILSIAKPLTTLTKYLLLLKVKVTTPPVTGRLY